MVFPFESIGGEVYEVPSDWTVHIQFNIATYSGFINVETKVIPYSSYDAEFIKSMQPTTTKLVEEENTEFDKLFNQI